MTDLEMRQLQRDAQRELDALEDTMLVSPLALLGLIERLQRCEQKAEAVGLYDELH